VPRHRGEEDVRAAVTLRLAPSVVEGLAQGRITDVSNQYEFVTRWRVDGTCGEVADILGEPLAFPQWWPSVYLTAEPLQPPDARGLGRRVRFHSKGWLPYTIRWASEMVESRYPHGFTIVANGDFEGRGVWTFEQDGP